MMIISCEGRQKHNQSS
uniref:Uncharacterized protein n=1 Tax=Rhizophora mucronata TaxID=61149 RepID=A0A2P2PFC5_RHIMU